MNSSLAVRNEYKKKYGNNPNHHPDSDDEIDDYEETKGDINPR